MTTQYHLTPISKNAKTGPIPVSTTSADTCPPTCPFNDGGCYAKSGPLALHWKAVTEKKRGDSLDALCESVRRFPHGQLWRHNQAGDLPGAGNRIAKGPLAKLVAANKGRRGFTYTHKPLTESNKAALVVANREGFTINVSANSPAEVDALLESGLPVVTVLPIDAPKVSRTEKGAKIVACPATQRDNVSCATCQLCQRAKRDFVIGFPAHGTQKKKANLIASSNS